MASRAVERARPFAEAMEDRILHSADLSPLLLVPVAAGDTGHHESVLSDTTAASEPGGEIVFIDSGLSGVEQLMLDLQAQRQAGRAIEIVLIDDHQDGIALIGQTLANRHDISAIHVLAHGTDGAMQLGNVRLDAQSLLQRADEVGAWGTAFSADADLLLYGCDVAQSSAGESFVNDLALLTGADVAASTDLTGATVLGGNWNLEFGTGHIEAMLAVDGAGQRAWSGTLAVVSLNATQDTYINKSSNNSNYGNAGSLIVDRSGVSYGDQRALLQFDLASIPASAVITGATLQLQATANPSAFNVEVFRLTEAWSQGSGTGAAGVPSWNDRLVSTGWSAGGGASFDTTPVATLNSASVGQHSWDLTSLVQGWVDGSIANNGVILASQDLGSTSVTYDSREGTTPPRLVVTYATPANTAPVLDAGKAPALQAVNEDAGAPVGAVGTLVSSLVDFATPAGQLDNVVDPDSGAQLGIAVNAAASANGNWWFSIDDGASWNALGTVSASSARLLAADAGTRLYFQPNADYNGVQNTAVTFHAWDRSVGVNGALADVSASGGSTAYSSASDSASLTVLAINDAPVNSVPASRAVQEDVTTAITGISVSDADASGSVGTHQLSTVQLSVSNGSVQLVLSGAATISAGANATATLTLSGSQADINASLANLRYRAAANYNGADTLVVVSRDGLGLTDSDSLAITVTPVNDPPSGANATLVVGKNRSIALTRSDFGFVDAAGEGNAFASVLLQLPSAGSLRLNGVVLAASTEVTAAQVDAGLLVYEPVNGNIGSPYATLKFQVRDDGGTAGGGVDLDPIKRTLTFNVNNTAPVITSNGGGASASVSVAENVSVVTTVLATDIDGDALTYSISGGADAARFSIDASSGLLRFVLPPDFELPIDSGANNVYNVTVRADDGTANSSQTLAVSVTDVNEALKSSNAQLVNSATGDVQQTSMNGRGSTRAIAMSPVGDHVVVWSSLNQDGSGWGVYGQRYDNGGAAVGAEFRVNQVSSGDQQWATVAMDAAGDFVVSWTSANQDGTAQSVYARQFAADGSSGAEFRVNTTNTGSQYESSVGMDANGNFVVVWQGNGPGDTDGIFGRRFAANGTALDATEFRINSDTSRPHYDASVSMNASGAFAVVWDNTAGVQLRRYSSAGVAQGSQINVDNGGSAGNASVAVAIDGSLVVVWRETALLDIDIYMRRYNAAGSAIAAAVSVNSFTLLSDQTNPSIAIDSAGNFIVGWEGTGGGDASGAFAQKFNATGNAVGSEIRLNESTPGTQEMVSLAMLDLSNFVAVWSGQGAGDSAGVFTRQYGTLSHAPVIVSNGGGETAAVNVAENSSLVTTVLATDSDLPAQTLVYSITGGSDAARFTIDAWSGVLSFASAPDYETPLDVGTNNVYDVIVQVSDGALVTGQAIAVTVTAVNDNTPVITSHGGAASVNLAINENTTAVTTITATDADLPAQSLAYSISGGADAARFSINAVSGILRFVVAPNFELRSDANADNVYVVTVSASDGGLTRSQTFNVSVNDVNDAPTGLPLITGTPTEDQPLSANMAGVADEDGLGSFNYQWLGNGAAIGGATGSTWLLGDADVGKLISVRVSYLDGRGTSESLTSAATSAVANINDLPTGLPLINGVATEDQTLTVDASGIADADGLGSFSYQWLRNGAAISGATGTSLLLGDADVDKAISIRVRYTDGNGTLETLTSAPSAAVVNVNDVPTGRPVIAGSVTEDQTLTANTASIADADGLGSFSYQWLRNGGNIAGGTAASLLLGDADVGQSISVRVSYTDAHGTAEVLTSLATAAVTNVNDLPTGLPVIGGSAVEDQTLSVDASAIADLDGLGSFSYQWLRNGVSISGATGTSLLLGDADVGKAIRVRVNYLDGNGTSEILTSAPTALVVNVNDLPVGLPTIGGNAIEDRTLAANVSGISDDDGLGSFSYQWLRDGSVISGATASTLVLGDADVGKAISLRVAYTDAHGTAELLSSAATAPVVNINDAPRGFNATLTVDRNGSRVLQRADFGFADAAGEGNAFASVLLQIPSVGSLRLAGSLLGAATEVTVAQLDAGLVVYAPAFGGSGAGYASIGFQVRDDGGTANGGVDLDPVRRSLSIDIVNHAPTLVSHAGAANVALEVVENSSLVTTVAATDVDADVPVYSIAGGADAARFKVDSATGVLSFVVPPNFEAPLDVGADNVYQVIVRASDGVQSALQTFAVTVGDVSEVLQNTLELPVNTITADQQETSTTNRGSQHAVAVAPNGEHLVVWSSRNQDGAGWGVYAQRFDKAGTALGSALLVNQTTAGDQLWASVAMDVSGRSVISWTSTNQDGTPGSIYARRFNPDGSASGGEFRVNSTNSGSQFSSAVGIDGNGNFVIVWEGNGPGDSNGIFARRFRADGSAIDAVEFRVNTDTSQAHHNASVSVNAAGAFAVAWDNNDGVQIRRYDSSGSAIGPQIKATDGSSAGNASIALADDGSIVVVWRETQVGRAVVLQRFSSTGAAIGFNTLVNTTFSSDQTNPSIAMDGQGNFIVAWEGNGVGDNSGVFAQKFTASGARVGGEFRLNTTTSGTQAKVSLAMLDLDNLVVVWSGQGATDGDGVYMRQYGTLNSAPLLLGANPLPTITEDQVVNNGALVSALIAGKLSDIDNPGALGIAVIGVDNSHGSWQFSINGGSTWTAFGAVDASSARLLAADSSSSVRFVPNADWNGTGAGGLQFRGWDLRVGSSGGLADATIYGGSSAFSDSSAASGITVTPVNDLPVGLPRIVGSAVEDQTLLADLSGVSDVDGLGAFNLQWLRNGVAISGATGSSLLLGDADVGKTIRLRVSYVDAQGTSELLTSATTAAVANVNDLPRGLPVIVGQATEDRTLVADLTGISDVDGLGSFSLQWQRDGVAINGATGSSLRLGDADVGKAISLRVAYVDGYGTAESVVSPPTAPVANVNDAPTGRPVIVGTAQEDRTLTADLSSLRDADGLGAFNLQWLRDGVAINGATASSLILGDADVGRTISLRVRYVDGQGTAEQLTSAATGPVANVNDAPTGRPVIVGTPIEDQTLSANLSGIADADGLGPFQIQWLRNGLAITGATGNDLLLSELDDGQLISLRVSYVDGFGQTEVIDSAATPPIVAVNDAPFVNLPLGDRRAIVGSNFELLIPAQTVVDPDIGDTLTWTVSPGNDSTLPAWLNFDSSTGRFYGVPARGDLGSSTIRLTATDRAGISVSDEFALEVVLTNQGPVAGALTDQSASQNTPFNFVIPAGTFSDADIGDVLDVRARLVTGGVVPAWLVFDPATQRFSGIPANADVGDLRIRVTATDLAGVSASSDFALRVANVNDAPIARPIGDQNVDQDHGFSLDVAAHFVDIDLGDQLHLDAKLSSGAALPAWLKFDAATGLMVGTPSNGDVGRLDIRVTATDGQGASTGLDFKLTVVNVNDAPRLIGALENRRATDGVEFNATIPAGRFIDIDAGDQLVFNAELTSGSALPDWLVFDPDTLNLRGTPANADIGSLSIRITATDAAGVSVSGIFRLTVDNHNDEPTLDRPLPDQLATQDQPFNWTLPAGHFNDVDVDDVLSYRATLTSGAALPAWLNFDPATQSFSGTPGNGDVGELLIRITASDLDGASVFGDFGLRVADVNDAPRLVDMLEDVRATDGVWFSTTIPAGRFIDIDAGDHLVFSAELASGPALPKWLTFDSDTLSLQGTPRNADIGSLSIRITATDAAGASVSATFRLTVDNRNDEPTLDLPLPDQLATQDQPFSWTLPSGVFSDADLDDVLRYRATLASGATLPAWLSFDPATLRFSGTPGNADVGGLQIRITASDLEGTSVFGDFGLRVADVNDAPHLSGAHDLVTIQEGQFNNPGTRVANLISAMVTDVDANAVTGIAVVAVDASHGTWQFSTDGRNWTDFGRVGEQSARLLAADATTAVRFVPVDRWRGDVRGGLTLRAWDQSSGVAGQVADAGNHSSHSAFSSETALVGITVSAVNHAPELVLPFIDRSAVEAQAVEWRLPAASFVDGDADDVLTYSATLNSGAPLPAWLKFDPATLTFKGSPQFADIGSMTIRVTATDAAGAGAQGIFTIKVAQAPSLGVAAPIETIPETATADRGKAPVQASASAGSAPGVLLIDGLDHAAGRYERVDGVLATATPIVVESDIKPVLIDLVEPARPASRDDAVMATPPSVQFSNLALNQAAQWLQSDEMLRKFDDLKHQMQDLGEQQQQIVASSLAISSGLSIGYVVWLVRGGVLVSSMLSALPAWQMIDPMPVLAAAGAARGGRARKGWLHKAAEGDDHAVEQLFDGPSKQQTKQAAHSASGISQHGGSAVHPSIQAQAQTVAATPPGHKS